MKKATSYITIIAVLFRTVSCGNLDLEKEVLPHLDCMQRVYLFGSAIQLKQSDSADSTNGGSAGNVNFDAPYGARKARSMNSFLDTTTLVFPSPVSNDTVSVKLSDILDSATSDVEGRGRLKKILLPAILALTIMSAIVIPALMTVIKLIAVKGLWSGVVSLIISKLLGLKALLSHHHHSHTVSDEGKRPYVIYLPNGKRRREEEEGGYQGQDNPWNQWNQGHWNNWRRDGVLEEKQ